MDISSLVLVSVVCFAFGYAAFKRVDVVSAFSEGATQNLRVAVELLPTLILLTLAIGMLRGSGLLDALVGLLEPIAKKLGFPAECMGLALLRPVSGSGATALLQDILTRYGPDSFAGRVASVLAASSETTFYTIAVYFGCVSAKRPKKAVAAALCGDLTAFVMSAVAVRIVLGAG